MQIIASHIVKLSAYIKLLLALFITLVSPTLFAHGVAEVIRLYSRNLWHSCDSIHLFGCEAYGHWI